MAEYKASNPATNFAPLVDERFSIDSVTEQAINNDYSWVGAKTVEVYSMANAEMHDYQRSGLQRYGEPKDQERSLQELTVSKDRSFSMILDQGTRTDEMMLEESGVALARQIREVIIPEVDIHRLSVMAANAGNVGTGDLTSDNAYDAFLDGTVALTNGRVPVNNRVAYVSADFYKLLKLDSAFLKAGDVSQEMLVTDSVGMVDNVNIIVVPKDYIDGCEFIITHPLATVSPVKLADYVTHTNPMGVNGWVIEGRVYYDAFVLENKKPAIYAHKADGTVEGTAEGAKASLPTSNNTYTTEELNKKTNDELKAIAKEVGADITGLTTKEELVNAIVNHK